MLLTAVITEPIFNLAFFHKVFYVNRQNVLFTFVIGLMTLYYLQKAEENPQNGNSGLLPKIIIIACGMLAVDFLKTDYQAHGVLVICLFYLFRKDPVMEKIAAMIPLSYEPRAFFSLIPIYLYNNERGCEYKELARLLYLFYPAHLLILYMLFNILNIGKI